MEVSREAVATLAAQAACQVPGVVSCHRSPVESLASRVKREYVHRGIKVESVEGGYRLGVHLKVEYGSHLPTLAREVRDKVREYLEGLTDVRVEEVEVIIEDVEPPSS